MADYRQEKKESVFWSKIWTEKYRDCIFVGVPGTYSVLQGTAWGRDWIFSGNNGLMTDEEKQRIKKDFRCQMTFGW